MVKEQGSYEQDEFPTSFPKAFNWHIILLDLEETLFPITSIGMDILNEVQLPWGPRWKIIETSSSTKNFLQGIHVVNLEWYRLREAQLGIYDVQGREDKVTVRSKLQWC